jgi:hypothetical protein
LHKGPVSRPQGSADAYAPAAFFTLRAHAARLRRFSSGLFPAVLRIAAILLNGLDLTNMNGPLLPLTMLGHAAVRPAIADLQLSCKTRRIDGKVPKAIRA